MAGRKARRWAAGGGLMLLAWLMAGCAQPVVDPGPTPARIAFAIEARFSDQARGDALWREQLVPPFFIEGPVQELAGPYWDWGLYRVMADGSYQRVATEAPADFDRVPARDLKVRGVFLAPPGPGRYVLLVDAYYKFFSGSLYMQPVGVATFKVELALSPAPGESLTLARSYAR